MRRPTPIPQAPRPAAEKPAARKRDAVESAPVEQAPAETAPTQKRGEAYEASPGVTISPAERDEVLAPVIPMTAPTPLPGAARPDAAPAPLPDMTQGERVPTAEEDQPVRLRDVWRAARARRRALRAEVRRFTVRQRRRRMIWIGAAASVLLLVLTTLAAAYSPLFGVERITVVGTSLLDAGAVEQALSEQLGTPLPLVDESAVKADLIAFPLVQSYSLEARPPHELVVRIVERLPIGLMKTRAGYTLVDAAGVALSTTETPAAGTPLLTITGGTSSDAFEAVGQVMRTLPASIRDQVTAVSASTPDDVTLTLGDTNTQVIWGSADQSALKALVLETTMKSRPPADVSVYDVSSPAAIVVR
ncbi:FtsQ-type POTRA domain-containing protein [Microbacterium sp. B2969]|uniref:FtsQ-type POTRA domain-containing protein n=1 Tax=Microbacterium alkaliflavum TaxID=3248839 RepID=A0ABW7QG68_9MICO